MSQHLIYELFGMTEDSLRLRHSSSLTASLLLGPTVEGIVDEVM